jgi:hypothetical protein
VRFAFSPRPVARASGRFQPPKPTRRPVEIGLSNPPFDPRHRPLFFHGDPELPPELDADSFPANVIARQQGQPKSVRIIRTNFNRGKMPGVRTQQFNSSWGVVDYACQHATSEDSARNTIHDDFHLDGHRIELAST